MPWTGDQLPWNFKYPKPPRPSGIYEPINYFPGNPILNRGRGSSSLAHQLLRYLPGGPSVLTGGMGAKLANLKYFPGGVVLAGAPVPIIAAKLQRFLAHP